MFPDTSDGGNAMLTREESDRYQRQLLISGWGSDAQERLKKSTVFVAGAGGLGSAALYYLAVAGIGTIRLCDFDTVELSNLNRQILHFTGDIGARKTDSARDKLTRANPSISVVALTEKLTEKNAAGLICNADIIIDCLDNNATRRIINAAAVHKGIPLVHGAVSGFQGQVALLEPPQTACLRCFLPEIDPAGKVPVAGATAGVIGALQAMEALKHLTGIGETLSGKLMLFDGRAMQWDSIALAKSPHCPACGRR